MLALALTRVDVANYVDALFTVYILLIFLYILLNLIFSFGRARAVLALVGRGARLPARRVRAVSADLPPADPADRDASTSPR